MKTIRMPPLEEDLDIEMSEKQQQSENEEEGEEDVEIKDDTLTEYCNTDLGSKDTKAVIRIKKGSIVLQTLRWVPKESSNQGSSESATTVVIIETKTDLVKNRCKNPLIYNGQNYCFLKRDEYTISMTTDASFESTNDKTAILNLKEMIYSERFYKENKILKIVSKKTKALYKFLLLGNFEKDGKNITMIIQPQTALEMFYATIQFKIVEETKASIPNFNEIKRFIFTYTQPNCNNYIAMRDSILARENIAKYFDNMMKISKTNLLPDSVYIEYRMKEESFNIRKKIPLNGTSFLCDSGAGTRSLELFVNGILIKKFENFTGGNCITEKIMQLKKKTSIKDFIECEEIKINILKKGYTSDPDTEKIKQFYIEDCEKFAKFLKDTLNTEVIKETVTIIFNGRGANSKFMDEAFKKIFGEENFKKLDIKYSDTMYATVDGIEEDSDKQNKFSHVKVGKFENEYEEDKEYSNYKKSQVNILLKLNDKWFPLTRGYRIMIYSGNIVEIFQTNGDSEKLDVNFLISKEDFPKNRSKNETSNKMLTPAIKRGRTNYSITRGMYTQEETVYELFENRILKRKREIAEENEKKIKKRKIEKVVEEKKEPIIEKKVEEKVVEEKKEPIIEKKVEEKKEKVENPIALNPNNPQQITVTNVQPQLQQPIVIKQNVEEKKIENPTNIDLNKPQQNNITNISLNNQQPQLQQPQLQQPIVINQNNNYQNYVTYLLKAREKYNTAVQGSEVCNKLMNNINLVNKNLQPLPPDDIDLESLYDLDLASNLDFNDINFLNTKQQEEEEKEKKKKEEEKKKKEEENKKKKFDSLFDNDDDVL